MRNLLRVIDSISETAGRALSWLCVALVLLLSFEVVMRYVFNSPTMWSYDTARMMGVTIAYGGWAYALRHNAHVRIDLLYTRWSPRAKAAVDATLTLLLFFPLFIMLTYTAAVKTLFSLSMGERLAESNWYPPAYPIRIVMFLGFCLFILQGFAEFVRNLYLMIGKKAHG